MLILQIKYNISDNLVLEQFINIEIPWVQFILVKAFAICLKSKIIKHNYVWVYLFSLHIIETVKIFKYYSRNLKIEADTTSPRRILISSLV